MTSAVSSVRLIAAAFNQRDIDRALTAMHSDVEWENGIEGGFVHGGSWGQGGLSFFPESAYAAAVLANYGPPAATDVARTIERLLLKQ